MVGEVEVDASLNSTLLGVVGGESGVLGEVGEGEGEGEIEEEEVSEELRGMGMGAVGTEVEGIPLEVLEVEVLPSAETRRARVTPILI